MVGNFCLAYIPLEQSQKCCGCWTVQHNFKKRGRGGQIEMCWSRYRSKGSVMMTVEDGAFTITLSYVSTPFQGNLPGLSAPCVGVILHWLTTSSPCFKTEREAISFPEPWRCRRRRTLRSSGGDGWRQWVGVEAGRGEGRLYLIGKAAQSLTQVKLECPQGPRGRYINADSLCKQERPWVRNIWRQLMV